MTLGELVTAVLTRLGDLPQRIWTQEEATFHLVAGYQELATTLGVFWDQLYLENLPRGASYSQPWERAFVVRFPGGFDYGYANFTAEFERRMLGDERLRYGPANHTSPFEATDGLLARAGASTAIPATAEVPKTVTRLERATWDNRGIEALQARTLQQGDSRYEITKGEVFGYTWQKDGLRTLRKVRVPSAQADTATINGSWGGLRDPTDLSTDTITGYGVAAFDDDGFSDGFFTDDTHAALWGVPRRIPGHHPLGTVRFGLCRRPYLEGKNVRVEHFRHGRAMVQAHDVCELPDRYTIYLRDYAQARLLERPGPGQDLKLAAHFDQRWARGLARITRRLDVVDRERTAVLGGDGPSLTTRPPRPSRPWAYGSTVR
jgi:hypothetical protein